MKENISLATAVLAIIIAIVAVVTSLVITPDLSIGAGSIGENELLDNAVTSQKIKDETIMLADLSSEVLASMSGVVEILDNSITGDKIVNGTITNADIFESAEIDPRKISGTAWTAINDGSGTNLDADLLDGIDSSQFLRNDISGAIEGDLTVNGSITHKNETRHYTLPHCAFVATDSDAPYQHYSGILVNSDPAFLSHAYSAPVNLPEGAELKKITVRYSRPDADASCTVSLLKYAEWFTLLVSSDLPQTPPGTEENYEIDHDEYIVTENTSYVFIISIDNNDSTYDVMVAWVCLEYIVTSSLP